jgi:hypothetical protein
MTTNPHNPNPSKSADDTLRIIAGLPAPAGLEDRVHATLRKAHHRNLQHTVNGSEGDGRGRVLAWPTALKPQSNWMRTAAAAAIVFVVAGGGWGVYTRVEQNRPARVLVMPARIGAQGGFANAGAMRTPQTIPGPAAPQTTQSKTEKPSAKTAPKAAAKPLQKTSETSQSAPQQ